MRRFFTKIDVIKSSTKEKRGFQGSRVKRGKPNQSIRWFADYNYYTT